MIPNYTPRLFRPDPKPVPAPKKEPKPIAKMSEKRMKEIKDGGQAAMFARIWETREHKCSECNEPIHTPEPSNFHHVKPKGKYPELRLVESNIAILCRACHFEIHFVSKSNHE